MPFSEGPRNCVGQTLAKIEVRGPGTWLQVKGDVQGLIGQACYFSCAEHNCNMQHTNYGSPHTPSAQKFLPNGLPLQVATVLASLLGAFRVELAPEVGTAALLQPGHHRKIVWEGLLICTHI
jgi:hypothetical protein